MARAVKTIQSDPSGDVVLVGHATAWTLLVTDLIGEPLPSSVPEMSMPDMVIVDTRTRTMLSPWGEWRCGTINYGIGFPGTGSGKIDALDARLVALLVDLEKLVRRAGVLKRSDMEGQPRTVSAE